MLLIFYQNLAVKYDNPNHWIDYAISRYNLVGPNDKETIYVDWKNY